MLNIVKTFIKKVNYQNWLLLLAIFLILIVVLGRLFNVKEGFEFGIGTPTDPIILPADKALTITFQAVDENNLNTDKKFNLSALSVDKVDIINADGSFNTNNNFLSASANPAFMEQSSIAFTSKIPFMLPNLSFQTTIKNKITNKNITDYTDYINVTIKNGDKLLYISDPISVNNTSSNTSSKTIYFQPTFFLGENTYVNNMTIQGIDSKLLSLTSLTVNADEVVTGGKFNDKNALDISKPTDELANTPSITFSSSINPFKLTTIQFKCDPTKNQTTQTTSIKMAIYSGDTKLCEATYPYNYNTPIYFSNEAGTDNIIKINNLQNKIQLKTSILNNLTDSDYGAYGRLMDSTSLYNKQLTRNWILFIVLSVLIVKYFQK